MMAKSPREEISCLHEQNTYNFNCDLDQGHLVLKASKPLLRHIIPTSFNVLAQIICELLCSQAKLTKLKSAILAQELRSEAA